MALVPGSELSLTQSSPVGCLLRYARCAAPAAHRLSMLHCAAQVASLAPKIDALEALWNRVRTISGADTPEDVLAYWNSESRPELSWLGGSVYLACNPVHLCDSFTPTAACAPLFLCQGSC
jgi:hypothetical protein